MSIPLQKLLQIGVDSQIPLERQPHEDDSDKPASQKVVKGTSFILRSVGSKAMFGLKPIWRGRVRVQVSDPARTVIDMLSDPSLAGGIRPAAERRSGSYPKGNSAGAGSMMASSPTCAPPNATPFRTRGSI